LLPQGEFDAFLLAEKAERGVLLEKLTGTEIYGRISTIVFNGALAISFTFWNMALFRFCFPPVERLW